MCPATFYCALTCKRPAASVANGGRDASEFGRKRSDLRWFSFALCWSRERGAERQINPAKESSQLEFALSSVGSLAFTGCCCSGVNVTSRRGGALSGTTA